MTTDQAIDGTHTRGRAPEVRAVSVLVCAALLLAVLAVAGQELAPAVQRLLASILMYVTLSQGWNIIGGMAGYPSFGNVAFFGVGGYTTAILMTMHGWRFWPTLPLAALVGALVAWLFSLPVVRLRGHYFAIATLGLSQATLQLVKNLPGLTGGEAGLVIPAVGTKATVHYLGNYGFFLAFLLLAVASVGCMVLLSRSRLGYGLLTLAQDEDAAASMGVNVIQVKAIALILSGVFSALAGAIYAFQQVAIYPDPLFNPDITLLMLVMVLIGGSGTIIGPVIGAVVVQFLSEYLRSNYTFLHDIILGVVVILTVTVLPEGLLAVGAKALRSPLARSRGETG